MADKNPVVKKNQISLEEYLKIKEKRAKSKLQLHFPFIVRLIIGVPAAYFIFLVIYFLIHLRFLPEH